MGDGQITNYLFESWPRPARCSTDEAWRTRIETFVRLRSGRGSLGSDHTHDQTSSSTTEEGVRPHVFSPQGSGYFYPRSRRVCLQQAGYQHGFAGAGAEFRAGHPTRTFLQLSAGHAGKHRSLLRPAGRQDPYLLLFARSRTWESSRGRRLWPSVSCHLVRSRILLFITFDDIIGHLHVLDYMRMSGVEVRFHRRPAWPWRVSLTTQTGSPRMWDHPGRCPPQLDYLLPPLRPPSCLSALPSSTARSTSSTFCTPTFSAPAHSVTRNSMCDDPMPWRSSSTTDPTPADTIGAREGELPGTQEDAVVDSKVELDDYIKDL